jgi:hypothetical protein
MDEAGQPNTAVEVASATMTEVADAARDQYDNLLTMICRKPLTSAGHSCRDRLHFGADAALKR